MWVMGGERIFSKNRKLFRTTQIFSYSTLQKKSFHITPLVENGSVVLSLYLDEKKFPLAYTLKIKVSFSKLKVNRQKEYHIIDLTFVTNVRSILTPQSLPTKRLVY